MSTKDEDELYLEAVKSTTERDKFYFSVLVALIAFSFFGVIQIASGLVTKLAFCGALLALVFAAFEYVNMIACTYGILGERFESRGPGGQQQAPGFYERAYRGRYMSATTGLLLGLICLLAAVLGCMVKSLTGLHL